MTTKELIAKIDSLKPEHFDISAETKAIAKGVAKGLAKKKEWHWTVASEHDGGIMFMEINKPRHLRASITVWAP